MIVLNLLEQWRILADLSLKFCTISFLIFFINYLYNFQMQNEHLAKYKNPVLIKDEDGNTILKQEK